MCEIEAQIGIMTSYKDVMRARKYIDSVEDVQRVDAAYGAALSDGRNSEVYRSVSEYGTVTKTVHRQI